MRIVPAAAKLNRRYAGRGIGYRVVKMDRSPFCLFTSESVRETMPGYYVAMGGVEVPRAGGFIIWGLPGADIVESAIQPVEENTLPAIEEMIAKYVNQAIGRIELVLSQVESIDFKNPLSEAEELMTGVIRGIRDDIITYEANASDSMKRYFDGQFRDNQIKPSILIDVMERIQTIQESGPLGSTLSAIMKSLSENQAITDSQSEQLNRLSHRLESVQAAIRAKEQMTINHRDKIEMSLKLIEDFFDTPNTNMMNLESIGDLFATVGVNS